MIWSFAERLAPRISSSLLLLILAVLVTPEVVGVYSWGALVYTGYQSISDAAVRQVVIQAISTAEGASFLRRYRYGSAFIGGFSLAAVFVLLYVMLPEDVRSQVVLLAPIVFAPACAAFGLPSLGRLQALNKWKVLASGQGVAAISSFAVALPILILTGSILGCSIALFVSELTFALWCRMHSRRIDSNALSVPGSEIAYGRSYFHMAVYSGLGWVQGQADRVLIGTLSGPAQLGAFSMASALARSLGEALASSTANLLRAQLSVNGPLSTDKIRSEATRILGRGLFLCLVLVVASVVLTYSLVDLILGPEWDVAIKIVPVIALCSFPSMLSWSSAALHLAQESSARAIAAPVIAIFFAVPVALLAAIDLTAAAWVVLVREVTRSTIAWLLMGKSAPWGSYSAAMGLTLVLSVVVLVISF